jgi:hypothetical protein
MSGVSSDHADLPAVSQLIDHYEQITVMAA